MKSYTSLEQSKRLAEILPIESADMRFCFSHTLSGRIIGHYPMIGREPSMGTIPCWSLAALLDVLPYPSLHKTFSCWRCDSYNKEGTSCKLGEPSDNPINACYEMIIKLNELKML